MRANDVSALVPRPSGAAARRDTLLPSFVTLLMLLAVFSQLSRSAVPHAASAIGAVVAGWVLYTRVLGRRAAANHGAGRRSAVAFVSLVLMLAALIMVALSASAITWRVGLATAALPAAYYGPAIERWCRRMRLEWPIILVGSAIAVYWLIGDMLSAQWSPIDDHEIMHYLGGDGVVKLQEIPGLLMETEVGRPGSTQPRYRPAYYTLRILETFLWRDSPRAWYASHMVMFIVSVALFCRFFFRWLGLVPGALLILYMLTYEFWAAIWCKLGPSEAYGALGTALYLEGVLGVRQRGTLCSWAILTLGALLAMGSKENLLVMLVPLWALAGLLLWRGRLGRVGIGSVILLTVYGVFIGLAVAVSIMGTGADVYARPVTAPGRLPLITAGLVQAIEPMAWPDVGLSALLVIGAIAAFLGRRELGRIARGMLPAALAAGGLIGLWVSQFVFYNGDWPTQGSRYDFPGLPAKALLVVVVVFFGLRLLRHLGLHGRTVRAARAGLAVGLLVLAADNGYGSLIGATQANVSSTRAWTARLDRAIQRAQQEPRRAIVITSHDIMDYEPIFAIPAFLTARRVQNPLFLQTPKYRTDSPLTQKLAETLYGMSRQGLSGFKSLAQLPAEPLPMGIGLSGLPPEAYENLGILWPMVPRDGPG